MFCKYCGKEIDDKAVLCPGCGCMLTDDYSETSAVVNTVVDDGNIVWALLGFFLPIVGLILYIAWNDTQPLNAKAAGKGALISVIVCAAIVILILLFSVGVIAALF